MAYKLRVKYLLLIKLDFKEVKSQNKSYCKCNKLENLYYVPMLDRVMCPECIANYLDKHKEVTLDDCKVQMENYNEWAKIFNLKPIKIPMLPIHAQRVYFMDTYRNIIGEYYVHYTDSDTNLTEKALLKLEFLGYNPKDCHIMISDHPKTIKVYENI